MNNIFKICFDIRKDGSATMEKIKRYFNNFIEDVYTSGLIEISVYVSYIKKVEVENNKNVEKLVHKPLFRKSLLRLEERISFRETIIEKLQLSSIKMDSIKKVTITYKFITN